MKRKMQQASHRDRTQPTQTQRPELRENTPKPAIRQNLSYSINNMLDQRDHNMAMRSLKTALTDNS
ncbi:MAG TPA: hypothetical protein DCW33_01985 [Proteobacteria bacterium]|nr:hypothetical protein [Pseudomonadota bacterium]